MLRKALVASLIAMLMITLGACSKQVEPAQSDQPIPVVQITPSEDTPQTMAPEQQTAPAPMAPAPIELPAPPPPPAPATDVTPPAVDASAVPALPVAPVADAPVADAAAVPADIAPPTPADPAVEAIKAFVTTKMADVKSLTADMSMKINISGMTIDGKGTIEYLKTADGKSMSRNKQVMTTPMGEMENTVIIGGDKAINLTSMANQKLAIDVPLDAAQKETDFVSPKAIENLQKEASVLPGVDTQIDGKDMYVLNAKLNTPMQSNIMNVTGFNIYINKETGVTQRVEMLDASGAPFNTITYSNVLLNPEIAAERFSTAVPEGYTAMSQEQIGAMMGGAPGGGAPAGPPPAGS